MFLLQCIFPDHFYAKNQIYMLLPHAQIYSCCIFAIELCYYFFFSRFQIIMKCVSIWPLDPALFSAR